jgi:ribosomal protein S18 acetylase RimI-like enzyme
LATGPSLCILGLVRQSAAISEGHGPEHVETVRALFKEYAQALNVDLCFQNFEQELAQLPGKYTPPAGRLLLATQNGDLAGCVGLRPLVDNICEMKRLYVRPAFRRHGLGRQLAHAVIDAGRQIGYHRMRLDTLASMKEAIALYASLGFRRIEPYYANHSARAMFLELDLAQ